MENETKTDASKEVVKEEVVKQDAEKTITVDIYGTTLDLPVSKAKEIIQKRDEKTKGYNELKAKVEQAEKIAKQEAERATLIENMKKLDAQAVEEQVAAKYKDTIQKFESKVFKGEISATLAKLGVLPEAISDAVKLVMQDAKAELDGDDIKLNGVKLDEYLKPWVEKKPHIVAVKVADKKQVGVKPAVPGKPQLSAQESLKRGLEKILNK